MSIHRERAQRVESFVEARVRHLQHGYLADHSDAVAALAKLRRGVGLPVDADIELFGLALSGPSIELLDEERFRPDEPTPEERAAFAAVTLYALHQQSRRDAPLHHRGYGLGRSARLLARTVDRDSVRQRFTALGTATTWGESVQHARGLIQQFRQHKLPLDYGRFARDLYDLDTGSGDRVRMTWGRDFYRLRHAEDDADTSVAESTDD